MTTILTPEKEKWFKDLVMHIFSALANEAYSYTTEAEYSIVKSEEVEEYVYLSTNVAATIMAHAIKQYYVNIKDLPRENIYNEVLNEFEETLKYQLQKIV